MKYKFLFLIFYTTIAFIFANYFKCYFFENKVSKQSIDKHSDNRHNTDLKMKDFILQEILNTKENILKIKAETGKIFRASNQIKCKNLTCYNLKNQKEIARIKSTKSLIDRNQKIIFCNKNVIGNFYELNFVGYKINYDFLNQQITTSQKITYTHPNINFIAQESSINLKENKIEMSGGIYCELFNANSG